MNLKTKLHINFKEVCMNIHQKTFAAFPADKFHQLLNRIYNNSI